MVTSQSLKLQTEPHFISYLDAVSFMQAHMNTWRERGRHRQKDSETKHNAASNLLLKLYNPGYLGITNIEESSGQTGMLPWPDLTRNGRALIFPRHMTQGTQIKSLLFTMTFLLPSFLREIFPPSTAISVTGHPHQNKRPSGRVTQSQYGRLVCV